ncbi:MAG: efflux transporter outer membrane subunit [Caulobacteraceae bacterium]|nr:efflux transporter outer membrane subunit [Caulobacter sp.]
MIRLRRTALVVAGAAAAALAGCTVGPDYRRPDAPTTAGGGFEGLTPKGKDAPLSATTAAEPPVGAWWSQFHDPVLDGLVARALSGNLDLAQASSRIRAARAQEIVAAAAGLPQVTATGNVLRDNRSATADSPIQLGGGASGGAAAGGASGAATGAAAGAGSSQTQGPSHINYFTVGADAIWEIDLFGGVRRSVEAARDTTAADVWSRRDSQVSIASEVASQYVQVRLQQARVVQLNADLKRQEGVFKIIRDRFATGFVTNLDVNQQRAQLASTQSQIPQAEAAIKVAEHALGVLLGESPDALAAELDRPAALPPVPPTVPAGLPSQLLRRRPDIRAAERTLASSNAQIGVQTAALYPNLNLVGLGSFGSNTIESLFDGRNAMSLGLALAQWNVFSAGANQANVRIAREQYRQQLYSYRKTVLTALQEVEDALARYSADQRRWAALNDSFHASVNSFNIASQQYGVGLTDYTSVYNAQGTLLQVQEQLTQADADLATDVVNLYKALGGGWSVDPAVDGKVGEDYPLDRGTKRTG